MAQRNIISTPELPPLNVTYSQAVKIGEMIYVAGQIGADPATGQLVTQEIKGQTERALENLKVILRAAGSSFDKVVKTTIYMVNMEEWGAMNEVYATYFRENPPAKTTVEVRRLALGALIEIEAIAAV
jgi:2-iminobutanoate/2-iminopropanoate deaminase